MKCASVCPKGAISTRKDGFPRFKRRVCLTCEAKPCSVTCPQRAIRVSGQHLTPKEVYDRIKVNSLFFRNSGGGVTLSGGEPLAQPVFVREFLKLCKTTGISVGVETSGHFKWSTVSDFIGDLDFYFYDIKCMDSTLHKQVTGKSNRLILQNIAKLASIGASRITVSVPIVPGVSDSEENILETVNLCQKLGITKIRLLQYHELGRGKYEDLGRLYRMPSNQMISKDTMSVLRKVIEKHGIECIVL